LDDRGYDLQQSHEKKARKGEKKIVARFLDLLRPQNSKKSLYLYRPSFYPNDEKNETWMAFARERSLTVNTSPPSLATRLVRFNTKLLRHDDFLFGVYDHITSVLMLRQHANTN
jgi:hypothetical protein